MMELNVFLASVLLCVTTLVECHLNTPPIMGAPALAQHAQHGAQHGQAINQHGQAINQQGQAINQQGQVVNQQHGQAVNQQHGQAVNQHGQAINQQGQAVNQQGQAVNQHGHEVRQMNQGMHPAALHNRAHIQDKDHLMEHYDGVVDQESMTEEEMNFHYFKVHDYDNNNKLDGIELISALTHYHKDDTPDAARLPDNELSSMIDTILKEDDRDNNGFIDYAEFIMSQNRGR